MGAAVLLVETQCKLVYFLEVSNITFSGKLETCIAMLYKLSIFKSFLAEIM